MPITAVAQDAADYATLVPLGTAYAGSSGVNHVSFRHNSLTSVVVGAETYQFAAYYRNTTGGNRRITLARRVLGVSDWELFNLSGPAFGDPNSNGTDGHNVISIGVDGDGYMHMSWGMHDDDLIYRKSLAPVTNSNPITFGTTNMPMTETFENSVTYPQFYNLPDGDLLFFYRNGSSGSGNSYLNRYDTATDAWSAVQQPLFDGITSSVNAYPNTLAFDSQGDLHFTWTDRSTPAFQTNHNIYYARSPDEGVTWTKRDGTPYALPILESTAEVVVLIPENSTLINQTSMTTDQNDYPLVASWWAPGAPQNDHTRQYMLAYYDGSDWNTSQITNRPPEPLQSDSTVRELARPLVMVDDENRVVVVMRYDQRDDVVTIGYSQDRQNWSLVDLTSEPLGDWEPTYDEELWKRENKLHLLYQPITGSTTSTISVLEWDARAFFSDFAGPPLELQVNRTAGAVSISNPADAERAVSAYSISSAGGQLSPGGWQSFQDQSVAGWIESQAQPTALAESSDGGTFTLPSAASVGIGTAFAGQPIAFGVDAPGDLTFQYTLADVVRTGSVTYTGESLNNLALFVDPDTGYARLENTSPFSVSIDGYTIWSPTDSLDPENWMSLDQQEAENGQWFEANVSDHRVSELQTDGVTLLAPGDSFYLGRMFDALDGQPDLGFEFLIAGQSVVSTGVAVYTSLGLPGDYNDDGVVDAGDYTVWRDLLGTAATLPNDMTPGSLQSIDYVVWISNFGRSLNLGSAALVQSVPEPSAVMLLASIASLHVLCLVARRRRGAGALIEPEG
jgi:hypothetical protein